LYEGLKEDCDGKVYWGVKRPKERRDKAHLVQSNVMSKFQTTRKQFL
jgi:hypothetical protein